MADNPFTLETPCEKPAPVPEPETIDVPPVAPVPDYLREEPVALLSNEQLGRLGQSNRLRELLKNEGLRKMIGMIDSSENPEYLLDRSRKENQLFMEFSEEILAVVGREPGQTGAEQVLEAMGMGKKV
ncbi:hypothetical protein BGW38_004170 [Lunasporangiospora selenospora]|uniref:Zinc finger HIT domain-containing protein n=1 Tax=Lunasporangiospora selenospora TaxID=979761 RepID=A0A9P6KBQ5_9FUNG|nr:hypothetical protein BGW38_004170 [Lunasporangiospora selenospora]